MKPIIDINFDFRSDTPPGKDPDAHSKTLRQYHKTLWSKELPCGDRLELRDDVRGHYLHHKSGIGEFSLSSDAVIPTFRWNETVKSFISAEDLEDFNSAGYTIGGMMVFPGNCINRQWTINQARGCTKRIGDRFDLTLECIRQHYSGGENPLSKVLARYADFFALFVDFRGYVEFFHLHDLVSADFSAVKISLPFNDFTGPPIPSNVEEYRAYENDARQFISARNQRILQCQE